MVLWLGRFGPLLENMAITAVSSRRKFRTAVGLAAATVGTMAVLNMMATARGGSRSHVAASGPGVVTVTRVVSNFEDCVDIDDGAQSLYLLPSESSGEVVMSIRDGFVLERGAVAEASTGAVFAVSGGCCLEDATVYSVSPLIPLV